MALADADLGMVARASTYEDAPATSLVATACAACGRPLLDAASLAAGMGPDCRSRLLKGWAGLPEGVREEANRLIFALAADSQGEKTGERMNRLRALGFDPLCDRMEKRLVKVTIDLLPGTRLLLVSYPFDEAANLAMRAVPGRRYGLIPGGEPGEKGNLVPDRVVAIRAVHRVLAAHFPGRLARSPKGVFVVPTLQELQEHYAISRIARDGATAIEH